MAEQDLLDAWHERAAIREYDGGMARGAAERAALKDVETSGKLTFIIQCVESLETGSSLDIRLQGFHRLCKYTTIGYVASETRTYHLK